MLLCICIILVNCTKKKLIQLFQQTPNEMLSFLKTPPSPRKQQTHPPKSRHLCITTFLYVKANRKYRFDLTIQGTRTLSLFLFQSLPRSLYLSTLKLSFYRNCFKHPTLSTFPHLESIDSSS